MCQPETREKLVEQVKRVVGEFYGEDPQSHPDYCRIINQRNFDRVSKLIDEKKVSLGLATMRRLFEKAFQIQNRHLPEFKGLK